MAKTLLTLAALTTVTLLVLFVARSRRSPVDAPTAALPCEGAACDATKPAPSRPAAPRSGSLGARPKAPASDAGTARPASLADARIQQALELFHEGRKEAALQLLEDLVKAEPSNSMALSELGMLYVLDPKTADRARELFRKAIDADPENIGAVEELYRLEAANQGPLVAVQTLRDAAHKHSDSPNVAGAYGKALVEQGRPAEALSYLQRAVREPNPSMDVQAALAQAYESRGDAKGQAETLRGLVAAQEKFLARHSNDVEVAQGTQRDIARNTLSWARALIQTRDFDGAESLLRSAAERRASPQELERLYQELQQAKGG